MIISPGRAFIFVHIPKTGGTSMAQALEARAHRDDILIGDTEKAKRRKNRVKKLAPQAAGRLWKHSTLADIRGVISPEDMDRMLCFCLVRNPWDRMVSYYHWLQEQEFDHQAVALAKTLEVLGGNGFTPHGALSMIILEDGPLFIADTHVKSLPTPEELARTAIGAARHVQRFGIEPNIALCSQSQFGNQDVGSGKRLRDAIAILDAEKRDFCYEGEMNVDTALDPELRARLFPGNRMKGAANVLIFAHADAASGVRNILKAKADGLEVGPILMGMGNRAHIVTPSITARGLLNMAAIAGTPVAHYG